LLDLYRSYFALVRVKVNLLREAPDRPHITSSNAYQTGCRYLDLATQYCESRQPFLAITFGVSGSGKSTIAGKLTVQSGAVRIRSDVERKRLAGMAPEQRSQPDQVKSLYCKAMSQRTFNRLETLCQEIINAGFAVIVDATFLHRRVRNRFQQLAGQLGVAFVIIECKADQAELRNRLVARENQDRDASDAGVAVMENQLKVLEPLTRTELARTIAVRTSEQSDSLWREVQRLCTR
jgi:predicted kinase